MAKRGNRRHSYNSGNQSEVLRAEVAYKQKIEANRNARRVARSQGTKPVVQPETAQVAPVAQTKAASNVVENAPAQPVEQNVKQASTPRKSALGNDMSVDDMKRELAFGLHTPDEKQALTDAINSAEAANKAADIETNPDTSDDKEKEKWKGEDFKEGDIIKYLYGKFLDFCSWGFDKAGNFLISASIMGGEFLGKGIKNTYQGGKELAKNYREKANIRDFHNSAQYIDSLYDREVAFYKNQRDYAIGTLNEAKAYALLLQNGTSLKAIKETYKKYGKKNKLMAGAYATLTQEPEFEGNNSNRFYTEAQHNRIVKENIATLKGKFGEQIYDAIVPHEKEAPEDFQKRSLETLNSAVEHATGVYEVQTGIANAVKAQTLAEYATKYNGNENLTAGEKEKAVRTLYHNNAKELNDAVTQRCGNIIDNSISASDLKAVNGFIDNRIQASSEILQGIGRTLDTSKSIGDKPREEFKAKCEAVHSIKLETPSRETNSKEHANPKEKRMDPLAFARENNKISPVEQKYMDLEAEETRNAAEKAKREERKEAFKQKVESMYKDTDWYKRHQERKQKRNTQKDMGKAEKTAANYIDRNKNR